MQNASQESVQSDKKKEVVLSNGQFLSVWPIKALHVATAADENVYVQMAKIMQQCCKIDDKDRPAHYYLNLDIKLFNEISSHLV